MNEATIEALASGDPDPLTPMYCTDCGTHLVLRDIISGRCSCGSGRVMTWMAYINLFGERTQEEARERTASGEQEKADV
jgi:hypothetical protein